MAKISLNLNEEVTEKSSNFCFTIPKMSHSLTSVPIVNLFTFVRSHSPKVTEKRNLFGEISQISVAQKLKFVKAVRTDSKNGDKRTRCCEGLFVHGSFYQHCNELTLQATDD